MAKGMELPEGIERELLDYLHLEFGERPGGKRALKLEDLVYVGEFERDGVPTHFWTVGRRKKLWATVAPDGDTTALSMTTDSPTPQPQGDPCEFLRVEDASGDIDVDIPLVEMGEQYRGLPDYHEIKLPRGEKVGVLAEVNLEQTPAFVVVSVEEGEKCVYVRSYVGVDLVYTTKKGNDLTLTFGLIEW